MVTSVGNTNAKIIVHDNATPGSGTYAWYIMGQAKKSDPLAPALTSSIYGEVVILQKIFSKKGLKWLLSYFGIQNYTDYDNLSDAIDYWEANDVRLYLTVKNEWGSNLAAKGSSVAPTTQAQLRGKLFNHNQDVLANEVTGRIEFQYTS